MSQLHTKPEVLDDGVGTPFNGYELTCQCSNVDESVDGPSFSEAFYTFWDPRHSPPHLHIQCIDCFQTYCPFQQCVPPPTAEVYGQ